MRSPRRIKQELARWNGFEYEFGHGTKHPYVELRVGARRKRVWFASSPSDHRGGKNETANLRAALREIGARHVE